MSKGLIVGVVDGEGRLLCSQPYNEYQYGIRSRNILLYQRGNELIEILVNELGKISYEDNKWILKQVLSEDLWETASRLLGNIAEAVLVRRCKENPELNWKLFMLARRKKAWMSTAQGFTAIGTGLESTRKQYRERYSHGDMQRDIIWIDANGQPALMNGSSYMSGIPAGIQVKVSKNGEQYVVPDIINNRYEVPVVYFPLNNDYERVVNSIMKRCPSVFELDGNNRNFNPSDDLVDIRAYDFDSFEEVKDYYPLVHDLLSGDLPIEQFMEYSSNISITTRCALMHTALDKIDSTIIV